MRRIIHLDMDAFFASVEQLDNPAYRGRPVIVGGSPQSRGVVSTCSYEARKYGIRSAMPLREAGRRCPHGIFLPGRMKRYMEVSAQIREIMLEYTPLVEPVSLDEAFLDVTASEKLFGPAEQIAQTLVDRINKEVGLPASVGVAHNKFLAKLGSDLKKPKGFVVIPPDGVKEFLAPLPVSKLWGVGPKTTELLHKLGVQTIGDLQKFPPAQLRNRLGETGEVLYNLAHGLDDRPVTVEEEAKSIGHEVTFPEDTGDRDLLEGTLLSLCERVARRMRKQGLTGRIITVKLRNADFKTITRRLTLPAPTDFEEIIFRHALRLAQKANWGGKRVRLVGISVSGLQHGHQEQIPLFLTEDHEDLKRLHETVDLLKDRFGETAITRGRLLTCCQRGKDVAFQEKPE
ncbi:MAG TPA: DNA polymerase IV [Bacillota bacterium]